MQSACLRNVLMQEISCVILKMGSFMKHSATLNICVNKFQVTLIPKMLVNQVPCNYQIIVNPSHISNHYFFQQVSISILFYYYKFFLNQQVVYLPNRCLY